MMDDLPADLPPEYVNASNAGRIVGVVGVFHFIAFTFVSLRLYVRLFMVRAFGVDDALIIAAAVSVASKPLVSLSSIKEPTTELAINRWKFRSSSR